MASSAAGDTSPPPPPPPGGWFSGLVSGAGRLIAAVLGPESASSDATASSPESSQSPPHRAHGTAEYDNGACFASDSYQLNLSGKEIVLKDSGEGSLAIVSEIDAKDAVRQLLMQETYSRSECDALIKIIQERVVDSDPGVDEPAVILPIAWQPSTQQHAVAYSSLSPNTTSPATSSNPAYSPVFDNIDKKRWLKKSSTTVEDPRTLKGLNHDMSQPVVKRNYCNTGDTFEESRRVRPKIKGSNTSEKLVDVPWSRAARTMCDDPCSVSKLVFQEDTEAAPSLSTGLQLENSSRNRTKGFDLQSSIPTKTRSPANRNRRRNKRNTIRSWNGLPQQSNQAPVGQEPDAGRIQAKRPVGRPRKARR